MNDLILKLTELIPSFLLVFFRISAMIMVLPIISYPIVPKRVRLSLSFVLSLVIFPLIQSSTPVVDTLPYLFINIVRETFIGFTIGFGAKLIFEAFNMTGSFIGRQMGIGIANVMDPTSQQQIPVVSQLFSLLMMTYFLTIDGHFLFIEVLFKNFLIIPVGGGEFTPRLGQSLIHGGSLSFLIALRLGIAAMIFLLVIDVTVGFLARVMPQLNIFLITLPLKIGAGIFILIESIDIFQVIFDSVYMDLSIFMETIILNLAGA